MANLSKENLLHYEQLANDSIKEISIKQYNSIISNDKFIPNIYKIPKYLYFDYVENNIENNPFISRDLKKFNLYKNKLAEGYKNVNEQVFIYSNSLYKYVPIFEDLNIFYLLGRNYGEIINIIKTEFEINFEEPFIASIPSPGFNAEFTKLKCGGNAILINRSSIIFLSLMNDLLNNSKSDFLENEQNINDYFIDCCVNLKLNKFEYLNEYKLKDLEKNITLDIEHIDAENIALFFIITHELWHHILNDTIYNNISKTFSKFDKNLPAYLFTIGAKWHKELQVDAAAIKTIILLYANTKCSAKTIYDGLCLSLIAGLINELCNNSMKVEPQPKSFVKLNVIESYLKTFINWDKDKDKGNVLSNFYFLWEKNKTEILNRIVKDYDF